MSKATEQCKFHLPRFTDFEYLKERGRFSGDLIVSDFAQSTGCFTSESLTGSVWLNKEDGISSAHVRYYNGEQRSVEMTVPQVGVVPRIDFPHADDFGLVVFEGKNYLTQGNIVCRYPQTVVPDGRLRDDLVAYQEEGIPSGAPMNRYFAGRDKNGKNKFGECEWIRWDGTHYAFLGSPCVDEWCAHVRLSNDKCVEHVAGTYDNHKQMFFRCEPVEAEFTEGGSILLKNILTAAPYVATADIFEEIKDTLVSSTKELPLQYVGNTKALLQDLTKPMAGTKWPRVDGACANIVGKKLLALKIGDKVMIKCEGREAVVRNVDRVAEIATLSVGGRALKYRFEDLLISE